MTVVVFAPIGGYFFESEYSITIAATAVTSSRLNLWPGVAPPPAQYQVLGYQTKRKLFPCTFVVYIAAALLRMANSNVALDSKATTALPSIHWRPGVALPPVQFPFPGSQTKRIPCPCICCCVCRSCSVGDGQSQGDLGI